MALQSFILHLHLLGGLVRSVATSAVRNTDRACEQRHRAESRCSGWCCAGRERLAVALPPKRLCSENVTWALSSFQSMGRCCGRDETSCRRLWAETLVWVSCWCLCLLRGRLSFRTGELQGERAGCQISKAPSGECLLIYVLVILSLLHLLSISEMLHCWSFSNENYESAPFQYYKTHLKVCCDHVWRIFNSFETLCSFFREFSQNSTKSSG